MTRIVVLTSGTNNVPIFVDPLITLGREVRKIVYDAMSKDDHEDLPGIVADYRPDWVLYVGAIEEYHGKPVPDVSVLARIGARWPLVHLCCDGAEPAWWPQLQRYYDDGRFALQVNIDGVRTGPIGERGMTTLCPANISSFPEVPRPWRDRPVRCGFGGLTHGGVRRATIEELVTAGLVVHRSRDDDGPGGYCDFLSSCRVAWNHPMTGGGTRRHVKARVVEAALAGCLLLELEGSPAEDWFVPGLDYLTYRTADDVRDRLAWADRYRDRAEEMALAFRARVLAEHRPQVFWSLVEERIGLGASPYRLREVPFRRYEMASSPDLSRVPILVESVRGVNVVRVDGRFYTVPQSLGPVELDRPGALEHPDIRAYSDLAAANAALRTPPAQIAPRPMITAPVRPPVPNYTRFAPARRR